MGFEHMVFTWMYFTEIDFYSISKMKILFWKLGRYVYQAWMIVGRGLII